MNAQITANYPEIESQYKPLNGQEIMTAWIGMNGREVTLVWDRIMGLTVLHNFRLKGFGDLEHVQRIVNELVGADVWTAR